MTMRDDEKTRAFNRASYGERIRAFRLARGLNQPQLAALLRTSKNYVSNWEMGRVRPDLDLIPELCRALGIPVAAFFGEEVSRREEQSARIALKSEALSPAHRTVLEGTADLLLASERDHIRTDVLGRFRRVWRSDLVAAAGTLNPIEEGGRGEAVYLNLTGALARADEVITVSGDSMEPTYRDGDELLIEHTGTLRPGEIGVLVINGEGFVKEYRSGGVYSHNEAKYPFRRFLPGDEVRCFGRVLGKVTPRMLPNAEERRILEEAAL